MSATRKKSSYMAIALPRMLRLVNRKLRLLHLSGRSQRYMPREFSSIEYDHALLMTLHRYAWIWVCFFMLALQQGTTLQLNALAYSNFIAAPEITTAFILSGIIGGVVKLPIAKILNLWGRAEGLFLFVLVYLLGMIIIASSNGPDAYAAGYVFYWIGYDAIYLILDVFVADTSGLRNRAFAFAFVSTPFICTAFTAPLLGK